MDHLAISLPKLSQYPVLQDLKEIYLSELPYNEWSSVCIKYVLNSPSWQFVFLLQLMRSISLVPIVICAPNISCPLSATFEIDFRKYSSTVKLNSSYGVTIGGDLFCKDRNCAQVTKEITNGQVDPIKLYIDVRNYGSMFKNNGEIFIWGRTAGILRWLKSHLSIEFHYILPNNTLKELNVTKSFQSISPLKMENATIGKRSSADVVLSFVRRHQKTEYSKMYPAFIDPFRVVIVLPKRQHSMDNLFQVDWLDYFMYPFFCAYIALRYASTKLQNRSEPQNFIQFIQTSLLELMGQRKNMLVKYSSSRLAFASVCFYLYMFNVVKMGEVIKMMANSQVKPHITLLRTIANTSDDIIITETMKKHYENLTDLIRYRLHEPTVVPSVELARMVQSPYKFMVVINNEAMQSFVSITMGDRQFYLVNEAFGLNLYSFTAKSDSVFTARIENCLGRMKTAGLLPKLNEWVWLEMTVSFMRKVKANNDNGIVTFASFKSSLIYICIINSSAIIVFLVEVIYFRFGGRVRGFFKDKKNAICRRYYMLRLKYEFTL